MYFKFLLVCLLSLMVSGCASSKSSSLNSELKVQTVQLKRQLDEKEAEIVSLKQEISSLNRLVSQFEDGNYQEETDDNFIEYEPYQQKPKKKSSTAAQAKKKSLKTQAIVRVNVDHKTIQTALRNAGYYEGGIDGKIGRQSKQAIHAFQKDHDLKVDGIIGQKTWTELKVYLD